MILSHTVESSILSGVEMRRFVQLVLRPANVSRREFRLFPAYIRLHMLLAFRDWESCYSSDLSSSIGEAGSQPAIPLRGL